MCKVSVLIPVYNVERYLRQCLDSVIAQTLQDIEILCINDGSTDQSRDILYAYAGEDGRIRVIDKENTGYGHSMNTGLLQARGEYIGIVESDDFAAPEMFAELYGMAKASNADMVKSNFYSYTEDGGSRLTCSLNGCRMGVVAAASERRRLLGASPSIWSGIYRRAFLEQSRIRFLETPGASYQDTGFHLKCVLFAARIVLSERAFLHYRIDNGNSSVKNQGKIYCICEEYDEVWAMLQERQEGLWQEYAAGLSEAQYQGYLWNLHRIAMPAKYPFLKRFCQTVQDLEKKGLLQASAWWNERNQSGARMLCHEPKEWIRQRLLEEERIPLLMNGICSVLRAYRNIYVFGGGNIAIAVVDALHRCGIPLAGIIVSDRSDINPSLAQEDVQEADSLDEEVFSSCVLVAVRERDLLDVYDLLHGRGCQNLLMMTADVRAALEQAS